MVLTVEAGGVGFSDPIHHRWRHRGTHLTERQAPAVTHAYGPGPLSSPLCSPWILLTMASDPCSEQSCVPLCPPVSSLPLVLPKCFHPLEAPALCLVLWILAMTVKTCWQKSVSSPCSIFQDGHLLSTIHGALKYLNTQGPDIPFKAV